MKKHIKEIIPAVILSFIASFMLYIYEPLITYSANMEDFWFDLSLMIPNTVLYMSMLFIIMIVGYIVIYTITYLATKKSTIFRIILLISFVGYLFTYIQGNFLVSSLPVLDGTTINWNSYIKENIISMSVLLVLIISEIALTVRVKIEKALKINKFITIATFIMLLASLSSTLLKPGLFQRKIVPIATNTNINNASSNKNFYIFLVDAVDSMAFSDVIKSNSQYANTFDDFTYYPDTVSSYTYTRDAIPFIFSGKWNENELDFKDYANLAYDESVLLKELKNKDYDMNFYDYQINWSSKNALIFSNVDIYEEKVNGVRYFKELTKYVLFKYLPQPLKKYSRIETADFDNCKIDRNGDYFDWDNILEYEQLKNNEINIIDKNYFQFMHIEGGHVPFDYDENVNIIPEEEGTYEKKLQATLKIIDLFLKRLKENNVYDNSVIIIMADHGYWYNDNGRQNPILFIKGIDEHHQMYTSDLPISYEDLIQAYKDLLNAKKSEELFTNINKNRIRRFLYNGFENEDEMKEFEQRGKAWDKSATFETGKIFSRNRE